MLKKKVLIMKCCEDCFQDQYIKDFITSKQLIDTCDFCGQSQQPVALLADIVKYIDAGLQKKYEVCPAPSSLSGVTYTLLDVFNRENILNPAAPPSLFTEIEAISQFKGLSLVVIGGFLDSKGVNYMDIWHEYCDRAKYKCRFSILNTYKQHEIAQISHDPPVNDPTTVEYRIDELFRAMQSIAAGHLCAIPQGTVIYRAQIQKEGETLQHDGLTSAPPNTCANNRMSPPGISCFYGCDKPDVCIAEKGASAGDTVAIGRFKTTKLLTLVDLTQAFPENIFDPGFFLAAWFVNLISREISKPINPSDNILEYIPTQIFCEFIRLHFEHFPVHGIKYRSAALSGGVCYVLFRGPSISSGPDNWLDFVDPPITNTLT